jgi:hypothetical protein
VVHFGNSVLLSMNHHLGPVIVRSDPTLKRCDVTEKQLSVSDSINGLQRETYVIDPLRKSGTTSFSRPSESSGLSISRLASVRAMTTQPSRSTSVIPGHALQYHQYEIVIHTRQFKSTYRLPKPNTHAGGSSNAVAPVSFPVFKCLSGINL